MAEESTTAAPSALPQPGDYFPSLDQFEQATKAAQQVLDPTVELIQGKERPDTLILICKRGRRKPGRRRAGERKLEDWELCPFTLSASLDDETSPPAYVVQTYISHHHLDQQFCSSSPAQAIPQLPVVIASAPTPNSMPPPKRRKSISGPMRNEDGRFISCSTSRSTKGANVPAMPFSIPLLPVPRRQRPSPRPSVQSDDSSPTLADTEEYLAWKEVLSIKTSEIPGAWSMPVARGRQMFKQWGWLPEGAAEEEPEEQEQQQAMGQDNEGLEEEEEEEDADYHPLEEQPDPSSEDFYEPQPKRRRKSTSRPAPVTYGNARPSTRSALRGSTRGSSIDASQSPEMRRGFWARDDDEDEEAEATMTPETPFMELDSRKRKRDRRSSADEDASRTLLELSSGGGGLIGLGLDLGVPAFEMDTEPETPAIVGTGHFSRPPPTLPFPCACHPNSSKPLLRIDTNVSESDGASVFASPQPITSDSLDSQAQDAFAITAEKQPQLCSSQDAVVSAIELTLPPPPAVEPALPLPAAPKKEGLFSLPSFKRRPSISRQPSTDSTATAAEPHQPSPSLSERTSGSPAPTPIVTTSTPLFRAGSECSDSPIERPSALVFKPRRAPKLSSRTSFSTAKPALKVALASAENATTSNKIEEEKQEDIKPTVAPVVDLLQQREEIKQLKARFFAESESEIDPLYCSSNLDHKLASLRSLGHNFFSNPAYTTLLTSHRPRRSQLPQPFLHVARDGPPSSTSAPSPASARPINPRLLATTSYLWGRDLVRAEMEWLEREEKGLWKLVEEMVVVREVNELWEKVGREMEEKERERERERESPKRGYHQHHSPSHGYGGKKHGRGGGRGSGGGGRGWRKGSEPPRGGWQPDPKGDRWAR